VIIVIFAEKEAREEYHDGEEGCGYHF